jgi:hypothetical protein
MTEMSIHADMGCGCAAIWLLGLAGVWRSSGFSNGATPKERESFTTLAIPSGLR